VARCGLHKKRVGICYIDLVFLYPLGFVVHVEHSSVSGARNVDALFFMLRWARCSFHKKRAGTHYAELVFLHPVRSARHIVHSGVSLGYETSMHYFSCSGGPDVVFIKSEAGHVTSNLYFCLQ
jgi:hypothetical protein